MDASRLGPFAALAGPGADQFALKLREPTKDRQHQPAVRCRGVGPAIGQRFETGSSLGDGVEDVEQVAGRAGQTIQPRYDQYVALVEPFEQLAKLSPVGLRA